MLAIFADSFPVALGTSELFDKANIPKNAGESYCKDTRKRRFDQSDKNGTPVFDCETAVGVVS